MIGFDVEGYRWSRLDIPSQPKYAAVVRHAVESLGAEAGLSRVEVDDLDLAVTEACANAIRHGSPLKERNTIRVTFFLAPGCVVVEVRDEGEGFVPASPSAPSPTDLREGGYGLYIMRQVTDHLEIINNGGTLVRLMKKRRASTPPARPAAPAAVSPPVPRPIVRDAVPAFA